MLLSLQKAFVTGEKAPPQPCLFAGLLLSASTVARVSMSSASFSHGWIVRELAGVCWDRMWIFAAVKRFLSSAVLLPWGVAGEPSPLWIPRGAKP